MSKPFVPQIVTGNDLRSGDVVFRTAGGEWSRSVNDAVVAETAADADALLKSAVAASRTSAVSIELIDVAASGGGVVPVHIRERIRVSGPTVQSDFRV